MDYHDGFSAGGTFHFEIVRNGEVIDSFSSKNTVTNQGLGFALDTVFGGVYADAVRCISIFEGDVTPGATLTASTYSAFCTETTAYVEASRPAYTSARTSLLVSNTSAKAEFTMTAPKVIYGSAIHVGANGTANINTKEGTSGVLFAVTRFASGPKTLQADDILRARYDISATSA